MYVHTRRVVVFIVKIAACIEQDKYYLFLQSHLSDEEQCGRRPGLLH